MTMQTELTEQKIQKALRKFFSTSNVRYEMDGLYVFGWESDKLLETRAGMIYEFEIKISRSDYQNDFKHKAKKHIILASALDKPTVQQDLFDHYYKDRKAKYPGIKPDDCLKEIAGMSERDRRMPNYFYYAVPDGMLQPDEIPPYAGLVYISEDGKIVGTVKAPQLHNQKYTDVELGLCEKFYYNMRTAIHTAEDWQKAHNLVKERLDEELASKGKDMTFSQLEQEHREAVRERNMFKNMYFTMVEGADLNTIERHLLVKEIKKHNPDFDYQTILDESDRIYKERYPDRK